MSAAVAILHVSPENGNILRQTGLSACRLDPRGYNSKTLRHATTLRSTRIFLESRIEGGLGKPCFLRDNPNLSKRGAVA